MPQIIVTAGGAEGGERAITLRERINASDFESDRFTTNLIERIAWAVGDAAEAEERGTARELVFEERLEAGTTVRHDRNVPPRDEATSPRELVEA